MLSDDERRALFEANERVHMACRALIDRVNVAADEGYNVSEPDVLSDAMWSVAHQQIAVGKSPFAALCERSIELYDRERHALDEQFPRRSNRP